MNPPPLRRWLLHRHLLSARTAAARHNVLTFVEHGSAATALLADLHKNASSVEAAHLAVVVAALKIGGRAAQRRDWSLAWSVADAVHNCGMLFTDPKEWDHAFFLDAFMADFEHRDDPLGEAIRLLRVAVGHDPDTQIHREENPPRKS